MSRRIPHWLPSLDGIDRAQDHLLALVFLRDLAHDAFTVTAPPDACWERIAALPDEHLGRALQAACDACATAWGEAIEGFFDGVDFERVDPATLRRGVRSVTALRPHKHGAHFGPRTHLGDVYEATRGLAVAQRQGAFFTPYTVASLLARVMGLGPWTSVLDPACGAGVMLIAALDALREEQGERVAATLKLVGVEIDPRTAAVARASLVLAGAHPDQFWIATGDGLEQEIVGRDRSDGKLKSLAFHFNLANPPFGRGFVHDRGPVARQPLLLPERVHYHEHPPQTARAA